jgi:catechol 2,3-dioxygenase-like lactoylglutathione lyase family enzyme
MRVNALDHVNIRTRDVAASARFYAELLDLEIRDVPMAIAPEQAQWLYDCSGHAIIHLFKFDCDPGSTGAIHHVALNCDGKEELLERLKRRGLDFSVHEPAQGPTLVFTRDPHGVLLELNFHGD